ncbi:hypothetical protein L218DRAFT_392646 [Marasmius fiardii PR-910]|nr:hypothetical protein L218DRAFT_392646 [Marasmius fiardii PR-910]
MSLCPYPKPLVHRCSRVGPGYYGYPFGITPSFSQFLTTTGGRVWDIKQYRHEENASNTAQTILSECGLSPNAKLDEVIRTNIWLEWEDTRFPQAAMINGGRALYTLCRAMYTPSRLGRRWIIAGDENTARANREAKVSGSMIQTAMCKHCHVAVGSYGIVKHLETQHGVTTLGPDDLIPSLEEEPWSLDFDVVRLQGEDPTPTAEAQAETPEVNSGSTSGIASIA